MQLPIERPGKVIAVGLNYRDHALESGSEVPRNPVVFAKLPSSLIGPGDPIRLPPGCREVDYEAELGVVIGATAKGVTVDNALAYVAGYVAVNDVSDRAAQSQDGQWVRAKSYDTFMPIGPRLVPAGEVGDPQALWIRCWLNGELVQNGNTADMIFDVRYLVSFLSERITLEPGDILTTGTPAGVGLSRTPPLFLQPGDEVSVEIEKIGCLTNPVMGEDAR